MEKSAEEMKMELKDMKKRIKLLEGVVATLTSTIDVLLSKNKELERVKFPQLEPYQPYQNPYIYTAPHLNPPFTISGTDEVTGKTYTAEG